MRLRWLAFLVLLSACSTPLPPTFGLGVAGEGARLVVRLGGGYKAAYLRVTDWDAAEGTLTRSGGEPVVVRATAVTGPDGRVAQLAFPAVAAGEAYSLDVALLRGNQAVGSQHLDDVALKPGDNALTLPAPLTATTSPAYATPAVLDTFVSSFSPGGAAGRLTAVDDIVLGAAGRYFLLDHGRLRMAYRDGQGGLTLATLAGRDQSEAQGWVDGPGETALFQNPTRLAAVGEGIFLVADTGNNAIRRVVLDAKDHAIVETVAGGTSGYVDGPAPVARFSQPRGMARRPDGAFYVADSGNNRLRLLTCDNTGTWSVSTIAGDGQASFRDGAATQASFNGPVAVFVTPSGGVYVGDPGNGSIRAYDPATQMVSTVVIGAGVASGFQAAPDGTVYFNNGNLNRLQQDANGGFTFQRVAGGNLARNADGPATEVSFEQTGQRGLGLDAAGRLLMLDGAVVDAVSQDSTGAWWIQRFLGERARNSAESFATDGAVVDDAWDFIPNDFSISPTGEVIVCTVDNRFLKLSGQPDQPPTLVAGDRAPGYVDGPGPVARFNNPQLVTRAPDGTLYTADRDNHCIRKIAFDALGNAVVSTIAGTPGVAGYQDGPANQAKFTSPLSAVLDPQGGLVICDTGNHCIRKLSFDGGEPGNVSTLVGVPLHRFGGAGDYADGPANSAMFYWPTNVAFSSDGGFFVADQRNAAVRKVSPDRKTVSTFAGGKVGYQDGPAGSARFQEVREVVEARDGTLYVLDVARVRKLKDDGFGNVRVSTVVGDDTGYADGPPGLARFGFVIGIALDPRDDLYLADKYSHTIRKYSFGGSDAAP